ncbi:MAG: hypothetical protein AB7Q17_12580 [Phycisphaerae bacterium]
MLTPGRLSGAQNAQQEKGISFPGGPLGLRRTTGTLILSALALLALTGCPQVMEPGDDGDLPLLDTGNNNTFDGATALALDGDVELAFRGSISGASDLDFYRLGTLSAGDRVRIDVKRTSGDLDAVAAVFDASENVHNFNDDRAPDSSDLNPLIDFVIRGPTGPYFLAVAGLFSTNSTGDYGATITIERGVGVPDPRPQTVFLEWRGGQNVTVENVGTFSLPAFSAADVGLPEAQTTALKDRIQSIVEERYQGFRLIVASSDDNPLPAAPFTTIYFGSNNRRAFAISEQIDSWNQDMSDNAIIFTGSFREAFGGDASVEQMAQAMGNTVAHEIGHLLGLVHTASCNDLMDTTCGNNRILFPQFFSRAALDETTFATGFQDAVSLLTWILGLTGI